MSESELVASKAYRLVEPGLFKETILHHKVRDGDVVVHPTMASICHADLRYYTGQRRKDVLQKKLPMALFHEGVGKIVDARTSGLKKGQRVVIVPNIPNRLLNRGSRTLNKNPDQKHKIDENYLKDSVFLGSGYDGIGQECLVLPEENVIPIPDDVPDEIAVLAELCSVSIHAIEHVAESLQEGKVAVFGDGPVGYLTAAALHHIYHIPQSDLIVFGAIESKLENFDFATTYLVQDFDFQKTSGVVTIFECTGGRFSESAINQAIDLSEPQGNIVLMGVSEERIPVYTRDVLEKGLTLIGSSRSTTTEFEKLMKAFQIKSYQQKLEKILPHQFDLVQNEDDLKRIMDQAVHRREWKKVIFRFPD